jgi:dihydroflavonol-4-reductase
MKIFITGATGFIGTQLLKRLTNTDHELFCLARSTSLAGRQLNKPGVNIIEGDIRDKTSVCRAMQGCDWVVHLAGLYSFWEPDSRLYREINVDGTRNVMECALESKVAKVVHISTVVTYGKPADNPFTEHSEPGPVRFSQYAETKFQGDQIVWNLHKNRGLPAVVLYPCAVCGAGDPKASGQYVSDLIHRQLPARVLQDGVLTFVHVDDVAEAIVRALEKPGNLGEKYLLGKQPVTFREVNAMVREISGVPLPILHMPDLLTMTNACILTGISNLIKKKPLWGMSLDQIRTMKAGFRVDGSKAERELGITYTPFRKALEEKIAEEIKNM